MFPTNRTRFCTEHLKTNVFVSYVDDLVTEKGKKVIVWQGVRRDESAKRAHARVIERVGPRFCNYRPIVDWTAEDAFAFSRAHGLEINTLYKEVGRVSCAPCIYSAKNDLRTLFASDSGSETLEKLREWERIVSLASKTGQAAFFQGKELAGDKKALKTQPLVFWERHKIDGIVKWAAKTTRFVEKDWHADDISGSSCTSEMGMCE
jgi:3'-phosphoadenosine 5'-phosphosulfate sulfotransferase (PAPS reductase)/FAD synthetase